MIREESALWMDGLTKEWWTSLQLDERKDFLDRRTKLEKEQFYRDWRIWARDDQLAPDWDWDTWLMLTGRGWGKTRTAVQFLIDKVETSPFPLRIAIVGQGEDDVRNVMINGESGFIACSPSWNKPVFKPSVGGGQLIWPNGSRAYVYSIADTEALRGPQFHYGWCDEPMAAPRVQRERALDNLEFCLRLGEHPQLLLTTTPKADPWLRSMERDAKDRANKIAITRGTTHDNAENLASNFLAKIDRKYGNTNKGRQEIQGKILGDEEGALWTEDGLEGARLSLKELKRLGFDSIHEFAETLDKIVVAVDPNTKSGETQASKKKLIAHAAGIVVIGSKGRKRYVLADRSIGGGPAKWSKAVIAAAEEFDADEVCAERNQGGEMIRLVLQQTMRDEDFMIPIHLSWSKKSKEGRAEPVSNVYDRGDVQHVGDQEKLSLLELQMLYLHEGEDPTGEDFDRCDALVGGLTRLGLKRRASSGKAGRGVGIRTIGELTHGAAEEGSGRGYAPTWGPSEL